MYSNNILNSQESMTILNACTRTVWKPIEGTTSIYTYTQRNTPTCMNGYIHTYIHNHKYTYTPTYKNGYKCVDIYMDIYVDTHTYIYIYIYIQGWMHKHICIHTYIHTWRKGASGVVMFCNVDKQTYTSEFESHWVPHSYGLVPHLSKKLSKLQHI